MEPGSIRGVAFGKKELSIEAKGLGDNELGRMVGAAQSLGEYGRRYVVLSGKAGKIGAFQAELGENPLAALKGMRGNFGVGRSRRWHVAVPKLFICGKLG
jgi:hypothetical protein